jgi:hypothetical protein
MVRTDYAGEGVAHTRYGTMIDLFDRLGIQQPGVDPPGRTLAFEAAWARRVPSVRAAHAFPSCCQRMSSPNATRACPTGSGRTAPRPLTL